MPASYTAEQRSGPRYVIQIPVRAEWDDERSGTHVIAEGETENVGPAGALVHLPQLPEVGSRVQLIVPDAQGLTITAIAEVLRLERNPVQPLAALQLIDANDEWRGLVWEPSAPHLQKPDEADMDWEH